MRELVITNAVVVTRHRLQRGSVLVRDGRIAEVDEGPPLNSGAADAGGDYLIPGLVEVHTDNLEKHLRPRSIIRWPSLSALLAHDAHLAAVGITTVLDAVCLGLSRGMEQRPGEIIEESIQSLGEARRNHWLRAEHFLHLRCELPQQDTVAELEKYHADPSLRLVSVMDHTPGQRQTVNFRLYKSQSMQRYGLTPEEWEQRAIEEKEKQARYAGPNRAAIVGMMAGRGIPLASHDDTTRADVEQSVREGMRISEFPTTLEAASAAREFGLGVVMGAPNVIAGRSQSGNIAAIEVAAAGCVDALSSDYAPVSLLSGAFKLHQCLGMPLPEALASVTANPAAMVGLEDRGVIEPGRRADLVQVRMAGPFPQAVRTWRNGQRVA